MTDLDELQQVLRRQRKDLEDLFESTASRSHETSQLLEKIEQLRRRAERTQQIADDVVPNGSDGTPTGEQPK